MNFMKTNFFSPGLLALAMAVVGAVSFQARAGDTAVATTQAGETALPPEIQPGTPTAEVLKLVQAGVDESVIQTYVSNCPSAFNLDSDKIIALSDAGLPGDVINEMIAHDKNYLASLASAPATEPTNESTQESAAPVVSSTEAQPVPEQPTEVTINYFNDNLAPYGTWVEVDGYGRCWRPNVVLYDATWRPYCDRGHWVYTDCGWYWNSDYSWGITFHYGRWFNNPRYGWCWWPDTVWAPSWVTWRSANEYCGWAPLPPLTVYRPGVGFFYRGKNVSIGFDFGLSAGCYTFVSANHFCDPRPRYHCVPSYQVNQIYQQTTVINNFNFNHHRMVNNGVSVTVIGQAARHPIQPVSVNSLGNPGHRGWHGTPAGRPDHRTDVNGHGDNHPFAATSSPRQANHPVSPAHLENGHSQLADNNNANHPAEHRYEVSRRAPISRNTPDRQPSHFTSGGNRLYSPHNAPITTTPAPGTHPTPSVSPSQSQLNNNNSWSFTRSQNHQVARPASPSTPSSVSPARPVSSERGNIWNNRNVVRTETHFMNSQPARPSYRPPVNNAPIVIGQSSPHNFSRPSFSPAAPRVNAAPATPSPRQNQQQIGGAQNWVSRNH